MGVISPTGKGYRRSQANKWMWKLALDIENVLHLGWDGPGHTKWTRPAYKLLQIILNTVKKGIREDESVTINHFGRFHTGYNNYNGKFVKVVRFRACPSLRRSLDDE